MRLCRFPSASDENETEKSISDDVSVSPSDILCSRKKKENLYFIYLYLYKTHKQKYGYNLEMFCTAVNFLFKGFVLF